MLNSVKFRKITDSAFNQGEVWVSSTGAEVEIVSVRKFPGAIADHEYDYGVIYKTDPLNSPEQTNEKDAWSFQVRYMHQEDAKAITFHHWLNIKEKD